MAVARVFRPIDDLTRHVARSHSVVPSSAEAFDAVVALCRPDPTEALRIGVPLETIFETADQHDVMGLVAARLLAEPPAELRAEIREGLSIYREGMNFEASRADAQLVEILELLAARGLPAMPFKGPFLAHSAYGDPSLRPCLDLDVMVHPDDVAHVLDALLAAGFVHQGGLGHRGVAALRRYAGEYILFRDDSLPVEPHWLPAPRTMAFDLDMEGLWRRAAATTFLDAPCYLPSPEDHLLLLAIHGAKSQWHRLKWVLDIRELLRSHPDLDIAALRRRTASEGCRRVLDLALVLSHRLFAVPEQFPSADAPTIQLADRVLARLRRTSEPPPGPYVVSRPYWQARERRRDRWRYAARTVFTPRVAHYQRLPLPEGLRWLHFVLKPPWDYVVTPARRAARQFGRISR